MSESLTLNLPDEAATRDLAARLAGAARPGDVLLLSGPVGAGKTAFARAFIRARLRSPGTEVPSPTFTLVQTYDDGKAEIWHADLYRLSHPDEALELGLGDAFETAICLVEWPDRLGSLAPEDALHLHLSADADGVHRVRVAPGARWAPLIGPEAA
ncbi:tRNA (adenosine(37)-N6)-threonylcarbamoyltransferase complex ATPase subunit type 1 TsaE [Wenxinia marina]|uniref:tRNA threonylcarbamoyladenosine biosynthesis protein TsaE n=1 Tax=Wenxinia marina DSM 24838 TaxID=1123501 RepID=A0A0D0QJ64_9RHOB|nr:tRNA (adenosine(37)-N6)-threonylcarbamoyltransferase complex ATPase subunit type 1 TsaE [Wenxinia marina]KIQ71083.1 ATPase, YjeE family [Wenxinia marina DSM 24838]GGL54991.1 tRNA (adenosine(37)-N6)-threonylcarbamoyltransferase complex ATPase subunit type 1 TsaE [Wenxinia marina]